MTFTPADVTLLCICGNMRDQLCSISVTRRYKYATKFLI